MSTRLTAEEYMASVGVDMLHPGGMKRTEELAKMCRISKGKTVLDVGCGYGKTACHLAKKYGCRVLGIDISETMIERARKKAHKENVEDMVNFEVDIAESISSEDESFTAVISEGTTVFTNKERAVREYARLTKHGGYIGLIELSWRMRPSKAIMEKALDDLQGVRPLEYDEWARLLDDIGLKNIQSRTYKYKSFSWDIIRSIGLHALAKVAIVYLTNSEMRKWINQQETLFREYSDYWGYGIYVGRKD